MTGKERIILFILATLNFTHILDFVIMVPLGNYLMDPVDGLNLTAFQFGLLVASYSISAFFSGLIVAMVINRFDRKRPLILAYIGFLAGTIACGLAPNYTFLLFSRIVAGLFGGILGAQVLSIVADLFSYDRRGRAVGAISSAFGVATVVGIPLSLYLTMEFDWHYPFLLTGGIGVVLIPFMIYYLPKMTDHIVVNKRNSLWKNLSDTVRIRDQRWGLIFFCLFMLGHFLIIPFIPSYLEYNKGFSRTEIIWILLTGGLASIVAAIWMGRFSDRKGKFPVFTWSLIFSLFLIPVITNMPDMYMTVALLFFSLVYMVVTCRTVMAQAMISEIVPQEQRGSFMSVNGSVQQLGQGLASLIAGIIITTDKGTHVMHHYDWVGYLSIIVLIASLVIARSIFKSLDKPVEEEVESREVLQEAIE